MTERMTVSAMEQFRARVALVAHLAAAYPPTRNPDETQAQWAERINTKADALLDECLRRSEETK